MGWIADILALPINMHRRLHMIRMATPPKEMPETYIVDDERAPGRMKARAEELEERDGNRARAGESD